MINSKFETLNPKQITNSNVPNHKRFEFWIRKIGIYLGFRN